MEFTTECQSLDDLIKSRSLHLHQIVIWTSICKLRRKSRLYIIHEKNLQNKHKQIYPRLRKIKNVGTPIKWINTLNTKRYNVFTNSTIQNLMHSIEVFGRNVIAHQGCLLFDQKFSNNLEYYNLNGCILFECFKLRYFFKYF